MPFRVVVGLPSFNEADTIAGVTAAVDAAVTTVPFPAKALLVNADSSSTDRTPEVFLATPTKTGKKVVNTGHASGKGTNTLALLRLALEEDADSIISVDTDLAEVPASWIHALLGAIREGVDFCYPLRPPTWNGGDLTYQLAYPALAGVWGVDLREPLCGDIALSGHACDLILKERWSPGELRYGGDFLIASLAAAQSWTTVTLSRKRRNKLRSFAAAADGDYRMGAKFAENALAVQRCAGLRLEQQAPKQLVPSPSHTPAGAGFVVPRYDPDLERLAASTSRRLRIDARHDAFKVFPGSLADRLHEHATSTEASRGLDWPTWRDCVLAWLQNHDAPADRTISVDLLETLFLNRVVGHHTEIAGTAGWYDTVRAQALDLYARRYRLWGRP
ncbi:MAG: hypothetical protein ACRDYX_18900 [Egibacteraceae bacterium]